MIKPQTTMEASVSLNRGPERRLRRQNVSTISIYYKLNNNIHILSSMHKHNKILWDPDAQNITVVRPKLVSRRPFAALIKIKMGPKNIQFGHI